MATLKETEDGFMGWVRDAARTGHWLDYHPLRSEGSEAGWPDLALVRPPRLILAELKSESGRLSRPQRHWLDLLGQVTGPPEVYLWRPADRPEIERLLLA